nr:DUF4129 domain-containing protein [uncultured Dongia sp.]
MAGAIVACLVTLAGAPPATAQDAKATVDHVLEDSAYQTEFPGDPPPPAPSASRSTTNPTVPSTPESQSEASDLSPEPPPAPLAEPSQSIDPRYILLALAIGCFVILGGYLLFRKPAGQATSAPGPVPIAATVTRRERTEPVTDAPAGPIDEAERLAAAGRYGDAIHVILLRFLSELRHAAHVTITDSSTSREVLRNAAVPPHLRGGLATVVGAVELCHFGGRDADEKLFRHCALAYQATKGTDTAPPLGPSSGHPA